MLIEDMGNLVCRAMFDQGAPMKVALISTSEGEDSPLKNPCMIRAVGIVVIDKIDLAPPVGLDEADCRANVLAVNPRVEIIGLSAWTDRLLTLLDKAWARI